jgi:hypothetical protein
MTPPPPPIRLRPRYDGQEAGTEAVLHGLHALYFRERARVLWMRAGMTARLTCVLQAFYKADSDRDALTRLRNVADARSSLVRSGRVPLGQFACCVILTRCPAPQLKCVALHKESNYDDPMAAQYDGTFLPWLQSALQEHLSSDNVELASAAREFLAQPEEASKSK